MAMKDAAPSSSIPATPALKKSSSNTQNMKNQKSILGFFQKTPVNSSPTAAATPPSTATTVTQSVKKAKVSSAKLLSRVDTSLSVTPAPSSDVIEPETDDVEEDQHASKQDEAEFTHFGTPSRRAKKAAVNYAESEDEEDLLPRRSSKAASRSKRRKVVESDDDDGDNFQADEVASEDDMDDFVVPDDSDEEVRPAKKRKRPSNVKASKSSSPPPPPDEDFDLELPDASESTARQWKYDPDNNEPRAERPKQAKTNKPAGNHKQKAHVTEPEQRYPWLATIKDLDRNSPGDPDYDPRTLYIPPMAWAKFSPFEKQYWEIKHKNWDTVVFFKKGKFYELYENDATIGHQLFDLKLTDRVNMRMVGVPEASLDTWANQFVAKGFKIARVDQRESALGKEMRERDDKAGGKPKKEDKVIKRELACILTAGTLVDGSMLQGDMSVYCVAVKESVVDDLPAFGIAFADTATGQFFLTEFVDDVDLTKFETFIAQTRPQELLLEKGGISVKALRIMKNNTGPTTIWNYMKPGKEFWSGDITRREIDASDYFLVDGEQKWPQALEEAKEKETLMSAVGALICYLRVLIIDRELVSLGNFSWYDPIRKASNLVLDGQTLINLEIFANSFDGGSEGTLFQLLNRCITPFGKRMFKQWVCHPLMDVAKINARLDAVDSLNADTRIRDKFSSCLSKMPDLERMISRVHAGRCKAQDFLRVLEGFEQIEYTISLLRDMKAGEGVIGQLVTAMPDLARMLKHWETAFDRTKARDNGILVPERGVETDFDESQDYIESIHADLQALLQKYKKQFGGSKDICFRDNGKEIFQLEIPVKIKNVPKSWDQMSATKAVKRYYFPDLRMLIRKLQEAQETHSKIVKEVAGRFYKRFDEDYELWLGAVKIIAQLDCLIGLAKASSSLGHPSCRPTFVEDERSVLEFEELRHPCMLPNVTDFIPNDINLGGQSQNITLLTGANAAGKSTVLRMTCVAVIMAQIGCHLPCASARLTPVDRIMSRLGANDNIFAAQSTFFVELSETKKILSEATPRSLVILDELGRGTSSYDGVAVAQAVLHHVATHVGCVGFFATHYHSLAEEFAEHPEITPRRMRIRVDEETRTVTFLYRLEEGVAEGSFGMHCASMCGIDRKVVERAEEAARQWEHTSRLKESLERARGAAYVPLGWCSDIAWMLKDGRPALAKEDERGIEVLRKAIASL